jgi:hypothetical protein
MNGIIIQKAANSKTANTLNKRLFLAVFFIKYFLPFLFFTVFKKCLGGNIPWETRLSSEQCGRRGEKDRPANLFFEKEKAGPSGRLCFARGFD